MVAYTILEYLVYAFVAYSSILMLIISTIKEIPVTKSMSIARALYMLLGVIFAFVIMGAGPAISMPESTVITTEFITNGSTGVPITNSTLNATQTGSITLLNGSVWMLSHGLMATVLIIYVIQQFVMLFFKTDT